MKCIKNRLSTETCSSVEADRCVIELGCNI